MHIYKHIQTESIELNEYNKLYILGLPPYLQESLGLTI